MKRILLLLAIVLVYQQGIIYAQRQGIALVDSLLNELSSGRNDTHKVKLLNRISWAYGPIDPLKGINYGRKALQLTEKLKWNQGIATSYNNLAWNYFEFSNDTILLYTRRALTANKKS